MKPHQISIIMDYVNYCVKTKDVKLTRFHNKYHPYDRKQSTIDLINRAFESQVLFKPRIYCLPELDVKLLKYQNVPLYNLFEQKKNDPRVMYMMALTGAFSLLIFLRGGKKRLTYMECTTPSIPPYRTFETINLLEYSPGKLPVLETPEWDPLHWKVYNERRDPSVSSVKIAEKLGVSYRIVLRRYKKILKNCKIWLPFFPNGYPNYSPYVITLKTEFENAIVSELRKLDRSSYIYKIDNSLMLTLFFDQHLQIDNFLKLEKNGMMHEVRVSFPVWHFDQFW